MGAPIASSQQPEAILRATTKAEHKKKSPKKGALLDYFEKFGYNKSTLNRVAAPSFCLRKLRERAFASLVDIEKAVLVVPCRNGFFNRSRTSCMRFRPVYLRKKGNIHLIRESGNESGFF